MEHKLKFRLMKLHQEKLEPAVKIEDASFGSVQLNLEELKDLCEFMDAFLYD